MNKYSESFIKPLRKVLINRSLMKKLLVSYITIIAIPIMVFFAYTFKSLEANAKKDVLNKHNYELNVEYDTIEKNIYIMRSMINTIVNNKDVLNYIDSAKDIDVKELINFNDTIYKQVTNLQNSNPNIKEINIFTNNVQANEIWPLIYREDRIYKNDWYKKTLDKNGAAYWNINKYDDDIEINSIANQQFGNLVVSFYKELKSPSNKHLGIIRINMLSKDFFPNMFNVDNLNSGQIFLFNIENLELNTNENNSFLNNFNFDREQFKEFIKDKLKDSKGAIDYKQGSEKYTLLYRESSIPGNYLLCVIPLNNITQGIEDSRRVLLFESLLLLILLSIIIYFLTKAILKRLYLILNSVKQVRTGNLAVDIPVYGSDEIGILAYNFREMMKTIDRLIQESIQKELIGKETELKALKSQIDAHFLFNTLENIRAMALIEENYLVADSLVSLGDMMRYNIRWDNDFVSLHEELNHIRKYVSLMTLRYEYHINLHINIDDKFLSLQILKLIIQPLVENAIKHGLSEKLRDEDGNIDIFIESDETYLYLNVMDDGKGMDSNDIEVLREYIDGNINKKFGLGIKNVNDRVKLFYGEASGVQIESEKGSYTKFIIKLYK
ncbi:sensor histidine kinase [Clostridium cellulovorans]|uniref:Integral membrane sensor signal transduction histidine kinase n=1 Tax=Clostridium cellulovorans (strain ATCC 35296 / DSM 3052 / OCM 3 / 743B) TaxID=573061 RepID=D9SRJ2_CLOC7|nr:histidine kinase [Clostridium cellulovorans]ADL52421.1 integral membrane sensor signal transduction histidine kinase [Clostridium cellulovorans 743B]